MKQIITFAVAVLAGLSAHADYSALLFKTVEGVQHSIAIPGLEVRFSDENLTASNTNTSITLPLIQIESMEFVDTSTPGSVDSLTSDRLTEKTTVYDLSGRKVGVYESFSNAMAQISSGMYLFSYADGTTFKIVKE